MNLTQFSTIIEKSASHLEKLYAVKLADVERYSEELKSAFHDFKSGSETLIAEGNTLKIGVVGQVKAGKSSFLNSLFFDGETVLPKASTPMTAGLTVLEYAEDNTFEVEYYSQEDWKEFENLCSLYKKVMKEVKEDPQFAGAPESVLQREVKSRTNDLQCSAFELVSRCGANARRKVGKASEVVPFNGHRDLQQVLNEYVGAEGEYTSVVKSLVIHLKDERLKGIRIVDTPGVNDPIVSRENRTRQFLHSCHGVFFLSYSSRFFDSMDLSFMNTRIGGQGVGTVLLLASKYDDVLQDQGMKFPDDLDGADEASRRALLDRFRKKCDELDHSSMDIKFDTTSGISYSLANKPDRQWDDIESHVAHQMKRLYPSAFETEEMSKETFLALANLEVIREEYLEGMFKKNKESIIQKKIHDYFELNTENLKQIVADAIERLQNKKEELHTVELAALKTQQVEQRKLFESLNDHFRISIGGFQNAFQNYLEELKQTISIPCCVRIPTVEEPITVGHPGRIWGTNYEDYLVAQIDTFQLKENLFEQVDGYVRNWQDLWRQHFEETKKRLFEDFCQKITDFSQHSNDLGFSDSYYRNLMMQTLNDIDRFKTLSLVEVEGQYKQKIGDFCDSQGRRVTTSEYDCKECLVQGKLNEEAWEKQREATSRLTTLLKDFCNEISNNAHTSVEDLKPKLENLKKTITEQLITAGEEYIRQLEEDLKNKEEVEQKISLALTALLSFQKDFMNIK